MSLPDNTSLPRWLTLGTVALGCLALVAWSIWPGNLEQLFWTGVLLTVLATAALFVLTLLGSVVFAILMAFPSFRASANSKLNHSTLAQKLRQFIRRDLWPILTLLAISTALIWADLPRKLAFRSSQHAFEAMLPQAPVTQGYFSPDERGAALGKTLGFFYVDRYATDSRGGTYFRVGQGMERLGIDIASYGFVHKPNPKGTPFGAARYQLGKISGDWYWFRVSDDWW